MKEDSIMSHDDIAKDKSDKETMKSIQDGKKAIEIDKKVNDKSEEELTNDAQEWHNEG